MADDKLNIDELDLFDDNEEVYDVVTMTMDDGTEEDFFVIDGIDVDKVRYLLLVKSEDFDDDEPEAFIFKEVSSEGNDLTYEPVENEAEYKKIMILLQNEDSEYEIKL